MKASPKRPLVGAAPRLEAREGLGACRVCGARCLSRDEVCDGPERRFELLACSHCGYQSFAPCTARRLVRVSRDTSRSSAA